MGRPKTIDVDRDELLLAICSLWKASTSELEAAIAKAERRVEIAAEASRKAEAAFTTDRFSRDVYEKRIAAVRYHREELEYLVAQEKHLARLHRDGLPYDVLAFTGKADLSPSWRLRVNQAIRQMEADGLVEIFGRKATAIWPTEAGLKLASELVAKAGATNG